MRRPGKYYSPPTAVVIDPVEVSPRRNTPRMRRDRRRLGSCLNKKLAGVPAR
jgi:hypothetical protein